MQALQISLLGPLQISVGKKTLSTFESNKVRALLVFLAVERHQPHNREALADVFWPETSTQSGLASLRYALADLRRVIGDSEAKPPYLIISRERLQFNIASHCALDIVEFQELVQTNDIQKLKQAIALYRGDLLAGFPSIESLSFEEWILLKREQYKREAVEALRAIPNYHEGRGEYQQALPFARRQVELEPWLEEAHQQLMRLLALDGQRSAALAQYETCRRTLASELNVEPTRETIQLYESIRDGRLDQVPALLRREPPAPGAPPFKGLQYFDETDADLYFGREALVTRLVGQIHSLRETRQPHFLTIIGASGSGKSSLVRAGLVPALRRRGTSCIVVVTPTEHPLAALSAALKDATAPKKRTVLFVDQFEELFASCQSETERKAFINKLIQSSQEHFALVIIALRADFYEACAPYEKLRRILSKNQEYIGPLTADELRRAIAEPARINGWQFEPGLTDVLLQDIGADGDRSPEPGALPLLSHALLETWHRRRGRMLTLAGYGESGRIHQAIAQTAETVFARLSAEEQTIARNIFLRLTELGDGSQETRRRVRLTELIPPPGTDSSLGRSTGIVLKMLSDARLVTTTEETAEVAHEALIREWGRLRDWLAQNREGFRLHRRITESAREWESRGRDWELVYRGTRLTQALEWTDSHSSDLNLLERDFLQASRAIEEQEFAERERQRQRELAAARKLAESERQRAEGKARSAQQLRQRAYYLGGILLLALVLAVVALLQRNAANEQMHLAAARELALASINNLNVDPELSSLLALQAVSESDHAKIPVPYEVQDALHRAIQASRLHYTLHLDTDAVVAYSPDGKALATSGKDKTVKIWDAATGKELRTFRGNAKIDEDIAFSPDGEHLAAASSTSKAVPVWDVVSGQELFTLTGLEPTWSVSFSPDGALLATAGENEAQVWNAHTGQLLRALNGQHAPIAFSPAGKLLATSGEDGTTRVWNAETWQGQLSVPYAANTLAFSPDGERIATAMTDFKVWRVSDGTELVTATGFTAPVTGIKFSPDGTRLATAGQDGRAIVWDAQTGTQMIALAGHAGAVNTLAFSPGCVARPELPFQWCGRWLATASRDGTAKVWDVSPAGSRELVTLPGSLGSFLDVTRLALVRFTNPIGPQAFEVQTWDVWPDGKSKWMSSIVSDPGVPLLTGSASPDGKRIITVGLDRTVKVWNAQTGKQLMAFRGDRTAMFPGFATNPTGTLIATGNDDGTTDVRDVPGGKGLLTLTGNAGTISAVAFDPTGTRIVTGGSDDGSVNVWDSATGVKMLSLIGHTMPVYTVSFSPDGKRIATAGMDQTARIWDATSGKNLLTLPGHTASVLALAFSPDGSLLVTGSHDATARVWDVSGDPTNGQQLLTLTGHDGWVDFVTFSPDGRVLATGSLEDGSVRLYILDVPELARLAQSRLTRSLTLQECQKYLHQTSCP